MAAKEADLVHRQIWKIGRIESIHRRQHSGTGLTLIRIALSDAAILRSRSEKIFIDNSGECVVWHRKTELKVAGGLLGSKIF